MIVYKLPNANAGVIAVTGTAALLAALINTAGSTAVVFPGDINSVDLMPEDGDVRMFSDGNTPTASKGRLLKAGTVYRFRGIDFNNLRLIRTGSSNVAMNVAIGFTDPTDLQDSSSGVGAGSGNATGGTHLQGATKVRTAFAAGVTLTAGAGNTTSSTIDLSGAYGAQVNLQITNGATGPTIAGQVQVMVANDAAGTLFVNYGGAWVASVANSAVSSISIDIPVGVAAVKIVSGSNTAQNVTLDADISVITAL